MAIFWEQAKAFETRHVVLATVVLAGLVFLSFGIALPNQPVGDDPALLGPRLEGFGLGAMPELFFQNYWGELHDGGLYRPLYLSILLSEKTLWGQSLVMFRLTTMLCHMACAWMVYRLVQRCNLSGGTALVAASVFAVHPVHVEAVTTIYGQADVLAAMLGLISLHLYLHTPRRVWSVCGASAAYAAGLLCKESIVLLPVIAISARLMIAPKLSPRRYLCMADLGWVAGFAIVLGLRINALGLHAAPINNEASVAFGYPWWAKLNLFVTSLGESARMLLLPNGQTSLYGHLRNEIFGRPYSSLMWILIAIAVLVKGRPDTDRNGYKLGLVWLAMALLPVINLLPIGTAFADRFMYWPAIGIAILLAAGLQPWYRKRAGLTVGLSVLVLALGVGQSMRVSYSWRSPRSHWQWTVDHHPQSPAGHARLALSFLQEASQGLEVSTLVDRAQEHADTALALNPANPDAWQARAMVLAFRGDIAAALDAIDEGLAQNPGHPGLRYARGRIDSSTIDAQNR